MEETASWNGCQLWNSPFTPRAGALPSVPSASPVSVNDNVFVVSWLDFLSQSPFCIPVFPSDSWITRCYPFIPYQFRCQFGILFAAPTISDGSCQSSQSGCLNVTGSNPQEWWWTGFKTQLKRAFTAWIPTMQNVQKKSIISFWFKNILLHIEVPWILPCWLVCLNKGGFKPTVQTIYLGHFKIPQLLLVL